MATFWYRLTQVQLENGHLKRREIPYTVLLLKMFLLFLRSIWFVSFLNCTLILLIFLKYVNTVNYCNYILVPVVLLYTEFTIYMLPVICFL